MRAKAVNEINFERGRDPKAAMNIGLNPKDPIPAFMEIIEEIKRAPENTDFTKFNKEVFTMTRDMLLIIIRDSLHKYYNLNVEVITPNKSWEDRYITMTLDSGEYLEIIPSTGGSSWTPVLRESDGTFMGEGSAATYATGLTQKINSLLNRNHIKWVDDRARK